MVSTQVWECALQATIYVTVTAPFCFSLHSYCHPALGSSRFCLGKGSGGRGGGQVCRGQQPEIRRDCQVTGVVLWVKYSNIAK